MEKKLINNNKGFSLIELMTVCVILGVLLTAMQVKMGTALDGNLISRGADMAYTLAKLGKHLSVLENKDYVFTVMNDGGAAGSATWKGCKVQLYKGINAMDPDDYTEFHGVGFPGAATAYVKSDMAAWLPIQGNNGAAIIGHVEGSGVTAKGVEGSGTLSDPYRTIFKYYGPCSGVTTTYGGKYHVSTNAKFKVSTTGAYAYTVYIGGGNFAGAPFLTNYRM